MNTAEKAILEMKSMDELAAMQSPIHKASPVAKLLLTIAYILLTVSFHKYDFSGLVVMVLFPIVGYQISGISVRTCFSKLKLVLPLVLAVGIFNPFFDHTVLGVIGGIKITGGIVSMATLMMKGVFALMASFLLAATTRPEGICYALRKLHCPKMITSLFLLTYRYVGLLLEEVAIMTNAYELRAPGQRGIHFKAWGSFLGQLLLRTMDRGDALYESMLLRGFHGEFYYKEMDQSKAVLIRSMTFFLVVLVLMILCRVFPVASLMGTLFTGGMGR